MHHVVLAVTVIWRCGNQKESDQVPSVPSKCHKYPVSRLSNWCKDSRWQARNDKTCSRERNGRHLVDLNLVLITLKLAREQVDRYDLRIYRFDRCNKNVLLAWSIAGWRGWDRVSRCVTIRWPGCSLSLSKYWQRRTLELDQKPYGNPSPTP